MLVFIGRSYTCRLLTSDEVQSASRALPPDDLPKIAEHGFFGDEHTFGYWPVDPAAYLDTDGERPAFLPKRFERPADWITTWGLAALEAEGVIESLKREMKWAAEFLESSARQPAQAESARSNRVIESKTQFYGVIREQSGTLLSMLEDWREMALSRSQADFVDLGLLESIFAKRLELSNAIRDNYGLKTELRGCAASVWTSIRRAYPSVMTFSQNDDIPASYRPFVEAMITDWRGHHLFGLHEKLSGQKCLITVASDKMLRTQSEHAYGMSIWCLGKTMAKGRYDKGRFIRHHSG